ncbi:MAG: hypothetical protein WC671_02920 [Candidatus Paceibacterota bacterium]|jgi:hypothetical protein
MDEGKILNSGIIQNQTPEKEVKKQYILSTTEKEAIKKVVEPLFVNGKHCSEIAETFHKGSIENTKLTIELQPILYRIKELASDKDFMDKYERLALYIGMIKKENN